MTALPFKPNMPVLATLENPATVQIATTLFPVLTTLLMYGIGGLYAAGLWALIACLIPLGRNIQHQTLLYHFKRVHDTETIQQLVGAWLIKQVGQSLVFSILTILVLTALQWLQPTLPIAAMWLAMLTVLFTDQLVGFFNTCFEYQKRPRASQYYTLCAIGLTLATLFILWLAQPANGAIKGLWAIALSNTLLCILGLSLIGHVHIDASHPQKALASIKPTGQTLKNTALVFLTWLPHTLILLCLIARFPLEVVGFVFIALQCTVAIQSLLPHKALLPKITRPNTIQWITLCIGLPIILSPVLHVALKIPQEYHVLLWVLLACIGTLQQLQKTAHHPSTLLKLNIYWQSLIAAGLVLWLPVFWERPWYLLSVWLCLELLITGLWLYQTTPKHLNKSS